MNLVHVYMSSHNKTIPAARALPFLVPHRLVDTHFGIKRSELKSM